MLSQPSTRLRCSAKVACTNRSSLLTDVTAIDRSLPFRCACPASDRNLPVHQARQEKVTSFCESPIHQGEAENLCYLRFDAMVE